MSNFSSSDLWATQVVARVNTRLSGFFEQKCSWAGQLSPRAPELVNAVAELTMRGGKRLRPLMMYAGFRAARQQVTEDDWEAVVSLGASLELLQSYLLIQDDWMDDDAERRGGPSTYAAFTRQVREPKLGASLAILASDIAAGFAIELLHATRFPLFRHGDALAAFASMHFEVVCGQQLDLLGHDGVALTHHLKTGSYTVRGPVALGALLAGASDEQLQALERFATPLGLAFQLRDDLLGTFGDSSVTGKPVGHDLAEGKYTALVAAARSLMSDAELSRLNDVLGNRQASAEAVAAVSRAFERCGVRAHVESELRARLQESREALQAGPSLLPDGVRLLRDLLERMAVRDH